MKTFASVSVCKKPAWTNVRSGMQMFCATLGLLLVSLPVFSQLNLGRIFGGITDQSGSAIVGATVTVIDVARGISRPLTPDSAGEYSAPSLTPGTYTVRVEANGFQTVERTGILVGVGQDIRVDITLQPGAQTQTITVAGEIPIVNTTNAQLGGTLESTTVTDLPLNAGQYTDLLNYQPGVVAVPGGGTSSFYSNGNRSATMVWNFDGLSDINPFNSAGPIVGSGLGIDQGSILPVDAIQEMTVIENPKAEYGWKAGAQVNVGLKSGTNSLHGTAKGFLRNADMDAKNPYLLPSQPKALDDLGQYGGTVGGPIKKDKIFFFLAYEGQHLEIGIPKLVTVPTTAAGLGPANSFPDAIAAMNAAGHPISPLSLNLAGCTAAGVCNAANGLFGNTGTATTVPVAFNTQGGSNSSLGKIDYLLNAHNSINGEYFFGQGQGVTGGAVVQPYWRGGSYARVNVARGVWVWTPNSSTVNEMRFGLDRENFPSYTAECSGPGQQPPGVLSGPDYATQFGFLSGANYCGFPSLTISGFTGLGSGGGLQTNVGTRFSGLDTVSYIRGKHQFKFGVNIQGTFWNGNFPAQGRGIINFGTTAAFPGATALEDFLSGVAALGTSTGTRIIAGNLGRHVAWNDYAGFVQDDWRLTRTLTVNLGLRYEYTAPITDRNNLLGNFDPSAPTGMVQAGIGGQGNTLYSTDHREFEPRLGLAWDVTGKGTTVVRAGGGVTYATLGVFTFLSSITAYLNAMPTGFTLVAPNGSIIPSPGTINGGTLLPSSISWAVNTPVFNTSPSGLACGNGFGAVNAAAATGAGNPQNPSPCQILGINPNFNDGYVTTWTLNVQHAFTNNLSMNIGYVGNHGGDLSAIGDHNMPSLGAKNSSALAPGSGIEELRRPYYNQFPYFGSIYIEGSNGESNYDALQVSLTQRVSHGLSFLAGYTLAHALDSASNESQGMVMDIFNPRLDYGNSTADVRHHFTVVATYLIPGKKAPGQLLKGWQLNSTVTINSGFPYAQTDTVSDISGTGEGLDRWTLVGKASSFKAPGTGTFPCFGAPGSSFARDVNCVDTLPAACIAAAGAEPNGPAGVPNNTGVAMLNSLGCYMENGSVIVPPAQGTFGSMARNMLRGKPFHEWDASLTKNWKFREDRLVVQFRAELYNVLNTKSYIAPTGNPSAPTTFGQSSSTVNSGSPVVGNGSPRETQLGLKFIF